MIPRKAAGSREKDKGGNKGKRLSELSSVIDALGVLTASFEQSYCMRCCYPHFMNEDSLREVNRLTLSYTASEKQNQNSRRA